MFPREPRYYKPRLYVYILQCVNNSEVIQKSFVNTDDYCKKINQAEHLQQDVLFSKSFSILL